MKKNLLTGVLALFGAVALSAQTTGNFKLGAHIGPVTGDADVVLGMNIGLDAAYVWTVAPNFDLGIASGVSFYTVKSKFKNYLDTPVMIPLAATGQYNFAGGPFIGLDMGYAFFTNEGAEGGFLYQPKVGYSFRNNNDLYLSYKGISNDGTLSSVNLGFAHKF